MAMLGLLELAASQGAPENELYRMALQANAYWFPEQYQVIARSLSEKGIQWNDADPKIVLSAAYSSASGFQKIQQQVEVLPPSGGDGCSV